MRLIFDIGHPAHVHLFRHLIHRVRNEGGEVLVAAREKDVTIELCEAFSIPYTILSKRTEGTVGNSFEFLQRTLKLWQLARKFKPDALLGTSVSIGTVGRLVKSPSFVFNEDDAVYVPLFTKIAYPTSNYIVTPACLQHEDYGKKHLTYQGYHELAYLHPDLFNPDPEVSRSIGINLDEPYFLLRFVSLSAHHDIGIQGIPQDTFKQLIEILSERGKVLISSEKPLPQIFEKYRFPLKPDKLHDVLANASMYIGDSQTLAIEAAMLGIPGIRCNSFVGRITCLEEIEHRFGLTKGFLPTNTEPMLDLVRKWLNDLPSVKNELQHNRQNMLNESVNLVDWQWQMLNEIL